MSEAVTGSARECSIRTDGSSRAGSRRRARSTGSAHAGVRNASAPGHPRDGGVPGGAAMTRDVEPLPHEPSPELRRAQEARLIDVWSPPKGWRYWSSVNNEEVGRWYTVASFIFFFFGGVLALLMRIQLAIPNNTFLSAETYNQVFTVHGSV